MCRGKYIKWSEEKIQAVKDNYPTMETKILAEILDVSQGALRLKAKEMGVQKLTHKKKLTPSIKEVILSMYKNHSYRTIAVKTGLSVNTVRKFINECVAAGDGVEKLTKEDISRILSIEKIRVYKRERAMECWGIERRTRLRLVRDTKGSHVRYMLKKEGYDIDRCSKEAFICNIYKRNPKLERKAAALGFKFFIITDEEDEEGNAVFEQIEIVSTDEEEYAPTVSANLSPCGYNG